MVARSVEGKDDPSRWQLTATILTRAALGAVAEIHDRTPVTLPADMIEERIDPWIEGDRSFVEAAVAAATLVAESLQFHRIASPIRGLNRDDSTRLTRVLSRRRFRSHDFVVSGPPFFGPTSV